MRVSSHLNTHAGSIILDASVVINLIASGYMEAIMSALPHDIFITDVVVKESCINPVDKQPMSNYLADLARKGNITCIAIKDDLLTTFLGFTGAPSPNDLGDGEAASLAAAIHLGHLPITDDRKALRVYKEQYPDKGYAYSIDLFCHAAVVETLPQKDLSSALSNALKYAKMKIPREYGAFVYGLIGAEQFQNCTSIKQSLKDELVE